MLAFFQGNVELSRCGVSWSQGAAAANLGPVDCIFGFGGRFLVRVRTLMILCAIATDFQRTTPTLGHENCSTATRT